MVLKSDQDRIKALLKDTITLLCRNGLTFKTEFSIEALIGITLDQDDVMLVSINESIRTELGSKLAAAAAEAAANNTVDQGEDNNYDDYSDGSINSPPTPNTSSKRRRKRRRSSGQGSRAGDQDMDDSGGGSESGEEQPPVKRITAKMKNAVKQEEDDDEDSKDIVFIKEEMDSENWQSTSQAQDNFHSDLSGIPSSGTSLQQQDNFDFLHGNTLVPMGSASQAATNMWSDMAQHPSTGQNMNSPATKRTSTVTSNVPGPGGDDSQQAMEKYGTKSDGPRSCHLCGKVLTTLVGFQFHMQRHIGKYKYNCHECNQGFMGRVDYENHRRKHTGERLACPHCPRMFASYHGLRQHKLTNHFTSLN